MEHQRPRFPGKCYGSTTISERGQIVIPAEARREMGLEPGTKLLIFGPVVGPTGEGVLTLMTAGMVTRFVRRAMERLAEFEQLVKEAPADQDGIE